MSTFDLTARPLLWIPVTWPGLKPGGEDGDGLAEMVEHTIELQVELVDATDAVPLISPDDDKPTTKLEAFMIFVKNWRKIGNAGSPAPFNSDNASLLLNRFPAFFDAFRMAYLNALVGKVEVREKNSDASPANGQAGAA